FSSRRRHTRFSRDWSSDVCSSDLACRSLREFIHDKNSGYREFDRQQMDKKERMGKEPTPWADEDLKKVLGMWEYANGPRLIGRRSEERRVGEEGGARV